MKTGELIKKYRKTAKMTQVELAEECGITDSAIRNYELGNRMPSEEQIASIAKALNISAESLREVPLESARQALELLFRLQDEFGLAPAEVDGEIVLKIDPTNKKSPKLASALKAWKSVLDSESDGKMTAEEVDAWRAEFPLKANLFGNKLRIQKCVQMGAFFMSEAAFAS